MRPITKKVVIAVMFLATFISLTQLFAATTRNVPANYPTIQAGIDAAQPGDTVTVAFGTYTGLVIINKNSIIVEGQGAGGTFLNQSSTGGTAVTFQNVTGSTLRGFTIKKAAVGVKATNSRPYLTNNIFKSNTNAVENLSSFASIVNNTFYGNTRALFTNSSSTLKNNIIAESGRYAVAGSKAGSITYNLFHGNTIGNYSGISAPPIAFNNITGNPLFVNFTSDFHLRSGSRAIKAGAPSLNNSFNNLTSDIGAYGGPNADVVPTAISGVTAVSAADRVTISWNKNMAYDITGYKVYYRTTSGGLTSSISSGDVATISLTSPTININQRYYFAVTAIDGNSHESAKSAEVSGAIDNLPPSAPSSLAAAIGDKRLYLTWSPAVDNESGVKGYKVHYGTSTGSYLPPIDVGNVTSYDLTGLSNGITYYIAVSAYDYVGNEGAKSAEASQSPQEVRGITGLKNTGGCFIATAAYGSYEERHVKILREFRDRWLIADFGMRNADYEIRVPNIIGRAFVKLYYKFSPPMADFITEHPWLKPIVRAALLPLIAFSWLLINHPISTLIFFFALTCLAVAGTFRFPYGRLRYSATFGSLLSILLLFGLPSLSHGDERTGFTFGFSYGQLEPASDKWKEIYEADRVSNSRISLGYRFNSALGVEVGGGYMTKNGKGKTVTGIATGAETTFQMAPVDMTLLYRLNLFPDQIIVPYIGGGLSYNLYWEKVKDGKEMKGGMWGHHATGGAQLLLDRFDRSSAQNFKEDYGIENTYLTINATHSVINDFGGETVDLGGWNYQAGLLFEF